MIFSEDEFLEWKQNPVTVEFFRLLKTKREEFKENLIADVYEDEGFVKGKASAMLELIEMKWSDLQEGIYGQQ